MNFLRSSNHIIKKSNLSNHSRNTIFGNRSIHQNTINRNKHQKDDSSGDGSGNSGTEAFGKKLSYEFDVDDYYDGEKENRKKSGSFEMYKPVYRQKVNQDGTVSNVTQEERAESKTKEPLFNSLFSQLDEEEQKRGMHEGVNPIIGKDSNSKEDVSVDRSTLVNKSYDNAKSGVNETPLTKHIKSKIKGSGPISIATFMHEALLNPFYGYYASNKNKTEIFGNKGDFITSPELSQVFGELIGLWMIGVWYDLGQPKEGVKIIEIGPGKGTLIKDCMRVWNQSAKQGENSEIFEAFKSSVDHVCLVEASSELRKVQLKNLAKNELNDSHPLMKEINEREQVFKKNYEKAYSNPTLHSTIHTTSVSSGTDSESKKEKSSSKSTEPLFELKDSFCDVPIKWYNRFQDIPQDDTNGPVIVIAHEFFDALPVYQFQYTKDRGWCEIMVDINDEPSESNSDSFKLVYAPARSVASWFLSLLKHVPKEVDQKVEVSPLSMGIMEQIGQSISNNKHGGASLVVDYGNTEPIMDFTLQGIKDHKFVNPLSDVGNVDLSTYVDFSLLKQSLKKFENIECLGPLNQRDFLIQMGIDSRFIQLLKNPELTNEEVDSITYSYDQLINEKHMGKRYKVMSVINKDKLNSTPAFEIIPTYEDETKQ